MELLMFIIGLIFGFIGTICLVASELDGMTEEELLEFLREVAEE
tara:strand:+ start:393 stop:524 length:132 start_codon:yes stop_codon:yes gene_type:complete